MKLHPAWLAAGLCLFVILACSLGKKSANVSTNSAANNKQSTSSSSGSSGTTSSGDSISDIHMAKDNGSGEPADEATSFAPADHTIHCVATLKSAKSGTRMKFSWWAIDADGSKNEKIKDIDYTTKALENVVHGHLTLPQDWPKGTYKVDVYVNGNLDKTLNYSVN